MLFRWSFVLVSVKKKTQGLRYVGEGPSKTKRIGSAQILMISQYVPTLTKKNMALK